MSPVAPRRRRSARTVALALAGVVVSLVLAIVVFAFAIPSLSRSGAIKGRVGGGIFAAGQSRDRAAAISSGGPILFSDPASGQRDIFLQHLGTGDNLGWLAFDARSPGQGRECTLKWDGAAHRFDDPCGGPPVTADGGGLTHYRVEVTDTGAVLIDLNPDHLRATSTTTTVSPTTTSSLLVTGTAPS